MKKLVYYLLVIFLLAAPYSLFGQTSYGTVAGSVTDPTGAAVQGAVVTVKSQQTGETRTATTTSNGSFRLEALGTGVYDATVTAPGFSNEVVTGLTVSPSVTTSLTPTLKVGQATDTVEVSGSREILKTESGEVSETIAAQEINQLPISGLNAYSLVTTLPGVTTVTTYSPTNGPSFVVNGSRPRENNYLIEGQDNNDAGITGQGLQPENEEAVDSVTFLLNANSAEFGHGGGGISNLVYHSGTNAYHGAVWDRILNSSLNALNHSTTFLYPNPATAYSKKTKSRENIYGFRFGGPILPQLKDKAFVFVSQQFDHYRASATLGTLVLPLATSSAPITCGTTFYNFQSINNYKNLPNVATLLSAYSGLASASTATCVNGKIVSSDPNYRFISLGPDPTTGVDRGLAEFGTFQRSLGNIQNSYEFVIKGDYIFSDKDKLQVRYVVSPFTTPFDVGNFPSQLPNLETDQHGNSYNAGIVENHTFSTHVFNEFRLSYGRIGFSFDLTPGTYANPLLGPTVSIASITGFGIPTNTPQGRFHNTYQLQDAITFVKGSHSVKTGFDVAQVRVRDQVPFLVYGSLNYAASNASATVPAYTGLGNYIDDYSGGTSGTAAAAQKAFGSPLARPTLNNQGYYLQDHWKAASNLAFDLGLRYEYYGAPFNYVPYPAVDPSNFGAATFPSRVTVQPNFANFGPRFGFAYTPFAAAKTVVRGGFGIFYDNVFTNVADNIQASSPNAFTPVVYDGVSAGRGVANWSKVIPTLTGAPSPLSTVTSVVPNLRNPYTMQFNVAVEQQLPYAMSLTATYLGNRGVHLYALDYINPTIAGTTTRLNTTRGGIAVHDNTGDQEYHAGTMELERKFRARASVRIAYTYSKDLDDVSEEYTSGNYSAYPQIQLPNNSHRGYDWGPSAYDHRQRAVLSTVYNVPRFRGAGFASKFLNVAVTGTGISGIVAYQSGSVINTQVGQDINGDGITNDRPVLANPNAPFNTFAVRGATADGFYTATTNPSGAPYCDGTVYNRSPTVACVPVTLAQVHYFVGVKNIQNATISRNDRYTPGTFQNDFTAQRTFKTFESQDFMVRAECFDCMNHANTGIPAATLLSSTNTDSSTTFNTLPNTTSGNRTLRFFIRYEF